MSEDLKIQAACTRTGCSMFAGGICATCGMEVPAGYGEPGNDLKERLLACPFCGSADIDSAFWMRDDEACGPGCSDCGATADTVEAWNMRASTARISELEAQLIAATATDPDVRWAVNALLETIASKFDGWKTFDIWRSEAATVVRGFKRGPPTVVDVDGVRNER